MRKKLTTWRLNNILLKKQWINEEIKREIKITLRQMIMKTQPFKNLWDAAKAVFRGKFVVIQAFFKKEEKSEIDNLTGVATVAEWDEQHLGSVGSQV